MIEILRTNSGNNDFIKLVRNLDADLAERDGEDHSFYNQFNNIDNIKYVVIAYENDTALGCGAIRDYDVRTMEIKRMYTFPAARGNGIASWILKELEKWTIELGFERCILETGIKQPEAINLYVKNGYRIIRNYGPYSEVSDSRCFQKLL